MVQKNSNGKSNEDKIFMFQVCMYYNFESVKVSEFKAPEQLSTRPRTLR